MRNIVLFWLLCVFCIVPVLLVAMLAPAQWSYAAIGLAVVEMIVLVMAYRGLFRPMRVISGGMNLLSEQDFSSRLNHVGQRDADKVVDTFNAMMDQLKAQKICMQEQEMFLRQLIDASPMGVMILDDSSRITSANNAACQMLGTQFENTCLRALDSPLGRSLAALSPGEVRTVRIGGRQIFRCSRLFFMDRGWQHPFLLIELMTDEVRAAEKQALTRVIRTMAHEVNNSMAGMLSTIDTVSKILSVSNENERLIAALNACSERGRSLTGFVHDFAEVVRIPKPSMILTDYQEVIEPLEYLLENLCSKYGAKLVIDVTDSAPLRLDPVLMQQAVVNIVKNAAESAAEGGNVVIQSRGTTLTVTDDGPGIAPEAEEQIFTALFTTKPDGQGLGLMLVGEILMSHGADFSLRTVAERTTVFTIKV